MALIDIAQITHGRGTYRIVAYEPGMAKSASDALKLRFEMEPDGRLIDITLSRYELDLIAEWDASKKQEATL